MSSRDRYEEHAAPPCAPGESAGGPGGRSADDVRAWRSRERERLIALRNAIGPSARREFDAAIARRLEALLPDAAERCVAAYWPIRGEPDLRAWYERLSERGAALALPVVVAKGEPLEFHAWRPGEALEPGLMRIPVPRLSRPVRPDLVIIPLLGFDPGRHRLGNGGGYYDRTLAAWHGAPLTVGVGYQCCAMRTIHPQPWDVPLDYIVTEHRVRPSAGA